MAITFEFFDDPQQGPFVVSRSEEGTEITRVGWINTDDPIRGLLEATGLPRIGDKYDDRIPDCRVVRIGPVQRVGGRDPTGQGAGGNLKVPVTYRTPAYGGQILIKAAKSVDDKWSELSTTSSTVTVYADWDDDGSGTPPIAGGNGAPKQLSTLSARVKRFYALNGQVPWSRLIELAAENATNDTPLVIPGPYGSATSLQLDAGQVRYTGFESDLDGQFLGVTHLLELAPSHAYFGVLTDRDGNIVASERRVIYRPMDMRGLW
jgi:hypothetical protein